jgi:hypothetical protein
MKVKTRTVNKNNARQIWELGYLEVVAKEGKKFLNEEQYFHAIHLCEELACESNPALSETQDVSKIDEFYELRDKGGILGNINLRIYFALFDKEVQRKIIVVLAAYKKEDEHQVAQHIIIRVRNRLRVAEEEIKKIIKG